MNHKAYKGTMDRNLKGQSTTVTKACLFSYLAILGGDILCMYSMDYIICNCGFQRV
jgi:hypothetical protein